MGLSLEFVTGSPQKILEAVRAADYEALSRLVTDRADFSLHLQPRDLQILSECAGSYAPLPDFRQSLTCYLDEADRGFFVVSIDWADAFASIDPGNSRKLTADWFAAMAVRYPGEELAPPGPAAEAAVRNLILLCREAKARDLVVMHIWSA